MKKHQLLLSLVITGFTVSAQAQNDPFAGPGSNKKKNPSSENITSPSEDHYPKIISVCYETFSLPLSDAAAFQREGLTDEVLYQRLVDGLKKGNTKQESFTVIRSRSGEKSSNQSVVEKIYPIEWIAPQIPNSIGIAIVDPSTGETAESSVDEKGLANLASAPGKSLASGISTTTTACAFDTRYSGLTIDVEAILGANSNIIDIRLSPNEALFTGRDQWGQEEGLLEMPEFESRQINTHTTAIAGKPNLLGTFNRPPHSKIDTDSASKVWFSFVTPTIVTIRP